MPKPKWARRATARPMRPKPTRPRVLPVTRVPIMWVGRHPVHARPRTCRSPSPMRRAAARSRTMAMSAVQSVNTSGVLLTAMPRAPAASRSTCSKPTP